MVIKYNIDNKSYYLRDLGDGSGTFVRLDIPLVSYPLPINKYVCLDNEAWVYNLFWRLSHGSVILH